MNVTKTGVVKHATYIIWRTKLIKSVNAEWERISGCAFEDLLVGTMLDFHLFYWGIDAGIMDDPGPVLRQPYSAYAALIFDEHPEVVEREVRSYQKLLAKEREENRLKFYQRGLY